MDLRGVRPYRRVRGCETRDADLADYLRAVSLPTVAWLGDFEAYVRTTQGLASSPVTAMRVFAWTMRS